MGERTITVLVTVLFVEAWFARSADARPAPIEAPVGGKGIALASGVVCDLAGSGWSRSEDARVLRPPSAAREAGKTSSVRIAASIEDCDKHDWRQPLVATAPWPFLNPTGVVAWIEEGRIDVTGTRLKGTIIRWRAGDRNGEAACLSPIARGAQEACSVPLDRHLQALPSQMSIEWWPAGAVRVEGALFYDQDGLLAPRERFQARVGRTIISSPLRSAHTVDLAEGVGRVPLAHPEAVASVECGGFRCVPRGDELKVLPGSTPLAFVTIVLRLVPGVFVVNEGGMRTSLSMRLPVLRCPLVFASGRPLRHPDGARAIMRFGARCERIANRLRWRANGTTVNVDRVVRERGDTYFVLDVGRIEADRVSVTASHDDLDGGIVAVATSPTMAAPRPVVTLEIPGQGIVDFIPRNREALVHLAGDDGHLSLKSVDGVYRVRHDERGTFVQAESSAEGMVSLQFGYRASALSSGLEAVDLAVVTEAGARPIRDACLPLAARSPVLPPARPPWFASWQAAARGSSPRSQDAGSIACR